MVNGYRSLQKTKERIIILGWAKTLANGVLCQNENGFRSKSESFYLPYPSLQRRGKVGKKTPPRKTSGVKVNKTH